jgi:hypothetical protein
MASISNKNVHRASIMAQTPQEKMNDPPPFLADAPRQDN